MWPFKCRHPAHALQVNKPETVEIKNQDYDIVTYHLKCWNCNHEVTIKYAALRGGVPGFMKRAGK